VRETTITPQLPLRVRAVSPLSVEARSAAVRGVLYFTVGTGGGLFRLGRRTRLVVLLAVCDCMGAGVALLTVSATRRATRIFRENIFSG
jgi:hypothetical protein